MRILLSAIDSKYIHSNLALRYLKKIAEGHNDTVFFHESTINEDVDHILADLAGYDPDLVVFSCYIWNVSMIRQLISALAVILPDALILCGGPEVAYDAPSFLEETMAHGVMAGDGEVIFPRVLEKLHDWTGKDPQTAIDSLLGIPGLYLKESGKVRWMGPAPLAAMEQIPFPYDPAELDHLKHRIIYYEGQRGCPFDCSYCLSSIDRSIRHKPLAMVFSELTVFLAAGVPLVKFVDRTFNIREDWAFSVLQFLIEETRRHGYATAFHFEVGAAALSERLIDLLAGAPSGLFQIEAGIQSTDRHVLALIQRRDDPTRLFQALTRILAGKRVHVHTDLIAGLPGDTLASFRKSFNECIALGPDMLQLGFLKVLKGTPLERQKVQLGIAHRTWPPYEVLATQQMSYADLLKIKEIEAVTEKYYNSGKFPCSMKYLLMNYEEPWELFTLLADSLTEYQNREQSMKFEDYYRIILEMWDGKDPEKADQMAEMLRFDYILSNRKGNLPEWLQNHKYNSFKGRIIFTENDNLRLKGNVARFKINMLRFWQTDDLVVEDQLIFYSLGLMDLIPVRERSDGDLIPV